MKISKNQSGNALWFILIAVALLGALTMVLSRGSGSVDQSGDVEQNRIKMSQIMRYAKGIEAGIQKLQQINGCSENEISFQNSIDTNYNNTGAPADESCHVFEPEGAGLEWRTLTDQTISNTGESMLVSGYQNIMGVGDDSPDDLIIYIPITQSLCTRINTEQEISTTPADITSGDFTDSGDAQHYIGSFVNAFTLGSGGGAPALNGKSTGCLINDGGDYIFYHVLLAR